MCSLGLGQNYIILNGQNLNFEFWYIRCRQCCIAGILIGFLTCKLHIPTLAHHLWTGRTTGVPGSLWWPCRWRKNPATATDAIAANSLASSLVIAPAGFIWCSCVLKYSWTVIINRYEIRITNFD